MEDNNLDGALSSGLKLVDLSPESTPFLVQVGRVYAHKKAYKEAISFFSIAIELDPICQQAHSLRSFCYLRIGDFATARTDADIALEIDYHDDRAGWVLWGGIKDIENGKKDELTDEDYLFYGSTRVTPKKPGRP